MFLASLEVVLLLIVCQSRVVGIVRLFVVRNLWLVFVRHSYSRVELTLGVRHCFALVSYEGVVLCAKRKRL